MLSDALDMALGASLCEYCQQNFRKFSVKFIDHDYIILCHVLVYI